MTNLYEEAKQLSAFANQNKLENYCSHHRELISEIGRAVRVAADLGKLSESIKVDRLRALGFEDTSESASLLSAYFNFLGFDSSFDISWSKLGTKMTRASFDISWRR